MFSLEGDKMTDFWPNDSLTLTFYVTFSNMIPNWTDMKIVAGTPAEPKE